MLRILMQASLFTWTTLHVRIAQISSRFCSRSDCSGQRRVIQPFAIVTLHSVAHKHLQMAHAKCLLGKLWQECIRKASIACS